MKKGLRLGSWLVILMILVTSWVATADLMPASKVLPPKPMRKIMAVVKWPLHELFRFDKNKNKKLLMPNYEIDYSKHDKQHETTIIDNRAYPLNPEERGVVVEPLNKIPIDLPQAEKLFFPELGAEGFKDGQGNVVLIYPARIPAPELKGVLAQYLTNVEVNEFPNQNKLLIKIKESDLGNEEFKKNLAAAIDSLDLAPVMIRLKFGLILLWRDKTYDQEEIIDALKDGVAAFHLNLPSNYDARQRLTTGANINPFYNNQGWGDFTFNGSIGFLDSRGEIDNLISIDALVANTKPITFLDRTEVPYPGYVVGGTAIVEVLQYKEIGPSIKITPFANENGFITVKIEQAESGDLATLLGTTQRPAFTKGNLTSEFVVRDGVPYVAAASINNNFRTVKRGLPLIDRVWPLNVFLRSFSLEKNQSQAFYLIEARVMPRDSLVGTEIENPLPQDRFN